MAKKTTNDGKMLARAEKMIARLRNPRHLGHAEDRERVNALPVWEWAEAAGRADIQAEIARPVIRQLLADLSRDKAARREWAQKLLRPAEQPKRMSAGGIMRAF